MIKKINKKDFNKALARITTIFILLICFLSLFKINTKADEEVNQPTVYANDTSVTQGGGTYIYIYAKDFVNISSLDLFVYYDSSVFNLGSVSKGEFISSALGDVNAETAGEIKLSFISSDGISGNGVLLTIFLYAKNEAEIKEYPLQVIVGDCYDDTLNLVSVTTSSCKIKVNSAPIITETVNFHPNNVYYEYQDGVETGYYNEVKRQNDEITISFYTYESHNFASADFEINYDDEMLALKSISLDESLKNTESAIFSINDKTAGYIKISYAALSGVPSYVTALEVTFVVIKDKTTRTQIEFTSSAIYDSDLNAYNGSKVFVNVDTEEIPKVITYPKVFLNVKSVNASEVELEVIAEKDTLLAAGDFFIEFNSNEYECTEIIKTLNDSMVVGNIAFKTNKVRFSFIYENGISEDSVIARLKFKVIAPCETVSEFILDGSKLTDKDFNEQTVEYVNTTVEIPHNYSNEFTVDKVSTCTENGIKSRHCTRCNKTTDVTLMPMLGHDLIHHDKLDPTCTASGHTEYDTCSRCDYTTFKELPATGHKSSDWIIDKDSTCILDGSKHKECTVCHETLITEVINKLGHDLIHHEKLDPTCTASGHTEYDTCNRCDYTTFKELPTLGHKESDWIIDKDSTCIIDGSKHKECTVCHEVIVTEVINKLGHDLEHHDKLDPTCTASGHTEYDTCSRCDYTTFKELPATGHKSSDWIIDKDSTCLVDGSKHKECTVCHETLIAEVINKLGHDLEHHDKLDPTCTASGHTEYDTCSRCDYTTYKELPSLGHTSSDWIIDKDSTCLVDGSKHKECTVCHETLETKVINKLGHNLEHHDKLDPTCTTKGHTEYDTCSRCDYTTYEELPATGHNLSGWIIGGHPTCLNDGFKYIECTICHETLETEVINKLGHDLIHHEKLDPTCTASGHTEYDTCSRCDYTTYKELPATGHTYSDEWQKDDNNHYHMCHCGDKKDVTKHTFIWIIDVKPTEETEGLKHEECETCKYERNIDTVIPKLDHTHNIEHIQYKAPTCTVDGNKEYYHCIKCDKYYLDETLKQETTYDNLIIKASHKSSDWIIDKDSTCLVDGSKHKECTVCHETLITEVINKLGHDLIHHEKLDPTCTASGHTEYDTCSRCDYTTYEELPSLGHKESDWIIDKDSTCLVDGSKHKECTVCHEVLETEVINKLGHDLIHHDKLDPTCTASGHTEYDTCSRCDYTTYEELPSLGHKSSDWIIDKDSTCILDGSKHKECTVCHETLVTEVINKLGHDLIHHEKLDPTCTASGHTEYDTCSRCDYTTFKELPSLGHKESDWIIDKDSTCLVDGSKHKECTVCHKTLVTEVINKLGHDLIHHEMLDPTCTTKGHTEYDTCSRCDYTTFKELPSLGHKESNWIIDKNSTCLVDGSKHKECTVCHKTLVTEVIDKVGHNIGETIEHLDPTCEANGYDKGKCDNCGEEIITVIPMLGHDLIHHEKLEPTCTEVGHTEYDTCSRCDYSNYEELPALGHTESDWIVDVEATTNAKGHKHKECTVCHEHLKERDIPRVSQGMNCNLSNAFRCIMNSLVVAGFVLLIRKKRIE